MVSAERGYVSRNIARIITIDIVGTLAPVALAILLNSAHHFDKFVNTSNAYQTRVS